MSLIIFSIYVQHIAYNFSIPFSLLLTKCVRVDLTSVAVEFMIYHIPVFVVTASCQGDTAPGAGAEAGRRQTGAGHGHPDGGEGPRTEGEGTGTLSRMFLWSWFLKDVFMVIKLPEWRLKVIF